MLAKHMPLLLPLSQARWMPLPLIRECLHSLHKLERAKYSCISAQWDVRPIASLRKGQCFCYGSWSSPLILARLHTNTDFPAGYNPLARDIPICKTTVK